MKYSKQIYKSSHIEDAISFLEWQLNEHHIRYEINKNIVPRMIHSDPRDESSPMIENPEKTLISTGSAWIKYYYADRKFGFIYICSHLVACETCEYEHFIRVYNYTDDLHDTSLIGDVPINALAALPSDTTTLDATTVYYNYVTFQCNMGGNGICVGCNGTGFNRCVTCGGTGKYHVTKTVRGAKIEFDTPCPLCGGSGHAKIEISCPTCNGNGWIGGVKSTRVCPACAGSKKKICNMCSTCGGSGKNPSGKYCTGKVYFTYMDSARDEETNELIPLQNYKFNQSEIKSINDLVEVQEYPEYLCVYYNSKSDKIEFYNANYKNADGQPIIINVLFDVDSITTTEDGEVTSTDEVPVHEDSTLNLALGSLKVRGDVDSILPIAVSNYAEHSDHPDPLHPKFQFKNKTFSDFEHMWDVWNYIYWRDRNLPIFPIDENTIKYGMEDVNISYSFENLGYDWFKLYDLKTDLMGCDYTGLDSEAELLFHKGIYSVENLGGDKDTPNPSTVAPFKMISQSGNVKYESLDLTGHGGLYSTGIHYFTPGTYRFIFKIDTCGINPIPGTFDVTEMSDPSRGFYIINHTSIKPQELGTLLFKAEIPATKIEFDLEEESSKYTDEEKSALLKLLASDPTKVSIKEFCIITNRDHYYVMPESYSTIITKDITISKNDLYDFNIGFNAASDIGADYFARNYSIAQVAFDLICIKLTDDQIETVTNEDIENMLSQTYIDYNFPITSHLEGTGTDVKVVKDYIPENCYNYYWTEFNNYISSFVWYCYDPNGNILVNKPDTYELHKKIEEKYFNFLTINRLKSIYAKDVYPDTITEEMLDGVDIEDEEALEKAIGFISSPELAWHLPCPNCSEAETSTGMITNMKNRCRCCAGSLVRTRYYYYDCYNFVDVTKYESGHAPITDLDTVPVTTDIPDVVIHKYDIKTGKIITETYNYLRYIIEKYYDVLQPDSTASEEEKAKYELYKKQAQYDTVLYKMNGDNNKFYYWDGVKHIEVNMGYKFIYKTSVVEEDDLIIQKGDTLVIGKNATTVNEDGTVSVNNIDNTRLYHVFMNEKTLDERIGFYGYNMGTGIWERIYLYSPWVLKCLEDKRKDFNYFKVGYSIIDNNSHTHEDDIICPDCEGKKTINCPLCGGTGKVGTDDCTRCSGTGTIDCPTCNGVGTIAHSDTEYTETHCYKYFTDEPEVDPVSMRNINLEVKQDHYNLNIKDDVNLWLK